MPDKDYARGAVNASIVALGCFVMLPAVRAIADDAPPVGWIRQIGTAGADVSHGVALDDAGNAYISGFTTGSLGGPNAGSTDAFLAKFDATGLLLWSHQVGTTSWDSSFDVAVDGMANAFISGRTEGSLGGPNAGRSDAFLTKFDSAGTFLWSRQIGTESRDESYGVVADGAGNVYISGYTIGSLAGTNAGSADAFLIKYDGAGMLLWSRQIGTADWDESRSMASDGAGNVYISGRTQGALGGPSAGHDDAFLTKFDSAGNLLWSRQIGSPNWDESNAVAVDDAGNVYISGGSAGILGGGNKGRSDAFLAKYDAAGTFLWSRQFETAGTHRSLDVAIDGAGNAYISGETYGSVGGPKRREHRCIHGQIRRGGIAALVRPAGNAEMGRWR